MDYSDVVRVMLAIVDLVKIACNLTSSSGAENGYFASLRHPNPPSRILGFQGSLYSGGVNANPQPKAIHRSGFSGTSPGIHAVPGVGPS